MNQEITTAARIPTLSDVEQVEAQCLRLPQVECEVTHVFPPGIYWRELSIPAGTFCIGHKHRTAHLNVMLKGRVLVLVDGVTKELSAPQRFISPPGVRKMVLALEDTIWVNVHHNPENETDIDRLEEALVEKSAVFIEHADELRLLQAAAADMRKH